MSFNQSTNSAPGAHSTGESLETQLRGMILTNNPTGNAESAPVQFSQSGFSNKNSPRQQRQAVPFFGMPGNIDGLLPSPDQSPYSIASGSSPVFQMNSNFQPVYQNLPTPSPHGSFFPGDFTNVPASPVAYQTYPGSYPGPQQALQSTNLQSPTGLHFSPDQPSDPQSQILSISPVTHTHLDNVPPSQTRNQYGQNPGPPQQKTSPRQRGQPPQMTAGRQLRGSNRSYSSNRSQHTPRAPPPSALDHFPPLGTQPTKTKSPPPDLYQQQQSVSQKSQRTQYQPLPINTYSTNHHSIRGVGPLRGNPRNPTGRLPQQYVEQIIAEQTNYLNEFTKRVIAEASPPESEIFAKHTLLKRLEAICKAISPDAGLVPFGSLVTGFATANSDLDVIFTGGAQANIPDEDPDDPSSDFRIPILLESKLRDQGFTTNLLTKTRVPILKLVQNATDESPYELQCDIGFSNHLAMYNTQMLLMYSKCDPRVKQIMIFIKWWAKRRHINSPYRGTLSSYGYALIVLHYLINIVKPPVLQNLQTFPVPDEASTDEIIFEGDDNDIFEIWFYKDIEKLPKSSNNMHIGGLLNGFFEYYAHIFQWGREVVSIRTKGGLLTKQEKGWVAAVIRPGRVENSEVKDRYLFAVEDPFETGHNVSRTCNGAGVARIKEEFRRAVRLIRYRDGGKTMSECLCMEAPPERPWVRREDRDKDRQGGGDGGWGGEAQGQSNEERHGTERARDGSSENTREIVVGVEASTEALKYGGPIIGQ